ncbi:MAG: hypothetical protein RDV48_04985 [Candidatus Eremiobacteraeota bacterium]|nr:hypothetical protein [Candidatus Eremiobacteraeota bacterium]
MELEHLIEDITAMVMERLASLPDGGYEGVERLPHQASLPAPPSKTFRGLVVLTDERPQMEVFWEQFQRCGRLGIAWTFFRGGDCFLPPDSSIPKVNDSLPSSWAALVPGADFLIVPVMTMTLCSKIASLIADDVPSRVTLQALVEGKPVLVGAEEISFLNRFSARLPKPLVSVLNAHCEVMRAMGLTEIPLASLETELVKLLSRQPQEGRAGNVITKADVQAAFDEGKRRLEFLRGTIVTPLAREYAEATGVEIILR